MSKICIAVLNDFINDSRVNRIVNTLQSDHTVTVLAETFGKSFCCRKNGYDLCAFRASHLDELTFLPLRFFYWQFVVRFMLFLHAFSLFRNNSFDILYCNDFNTLISLFPLRLFHNFRIIYDSHELWTERNGAKDTLTHRLININEKLIESFLIRIADLVITVSDSIASELSSRYRIKQPIVVRNVDERKEIPPDEIRMKIRRSLNIPVDSVLLLYQGILSDPRGIPELLKALDILPERFHLLLLGYRVSASTKQLIENHSRAYFPGMIEHSGLHSFSSCADIGIAPIKTEGYLSHYLTFPNKFSEYMNAGLALALYTAPESCHIIRDCRCGALIPEITPESIAETILSVERHMDEYRKNARACFLDRYSWESEMDVLNDAVKQLTLPAHRMSI